MARRLFRPGYLLCTAGLLLVVFLAHTLWLSAAGVCPGPRRWARPRPISPWCSAGDSYGHRILKAGELVRAGYVPLVLVSGPPGNYGYYECDLAIPFAVRRGFPAEWFAGLTHECPFDEDRRVGYPAGAAAAQRQELSAGDQRLPLRPRPPHLSCRRTRHGRRSALPRGDVPRRVFPAGSWWRTRQGQKIAFTEWSKTVATVFGF